MSIHTQQHADHVLDRRQHPRVRAVGGLQACHFFVVGLELNFFRSDADDLLALDTAAAH